MGQLWGFEKGPGGVRDKERWPQIWLFRLPVSLVSQIWSGIWGRIFLYDSKGQDTIPDQIKGRLRLRFRMLGFKRISWPGSNT